MDQDSRVLALLAAPTKRVRAWYTSLVGNPLIMVASYSDDLSDLQRKLETMSDVEVLVLDAELFGGPDELRAMLEAFPDVITFVILPPEAGQPEIETVLSMPTVAGGWRGDVKLPEVVGEIRDAVERVRGPLPQPVPASPVASFIPEAPEPVAPAPPPAKTLPMEVSSPSPASPPPPGGGRVVAFWSGPSGGTGCTTLALAFSALAASRGIDTILLAFSEPAVSIYLHLDRVPNVESFFTVQKDRLQAAMQRVGWGGQSNRVGMQVILGPARPRDGKITKEQLSSVIEAARAAYPIVVVDVPSLPPGGNPWSMEPLRHATDIVLVMAPILTGISATVEALATLDELS
ncbi:MAG: hypothetical protein JW704_12920, partial [Anaerolineaceae bacterium]|nr:hypothetical protein [Anaerolineaceae bacterium]